MRRLVAIALMAGPVFGQTLLQQNYDARQYVWSRTNGLGASGDLSSSGAGKSILLSPPPKGVFGSSSNHRVYISGGTGTAEAALITGGTCAASSVSSCTIIVTTANTHTGAWTVGGSGAQEAICALPAGGGSVVIPASLTLYSDVSSCGKTNVSVEKYAGAAVSGSYTILGVSISGNPAAVKLGPNPTAGAYQIVTGNTGNTAAPYNTGTPTLFGVYAGDASHQYPGGANGIQTFFAADSTWAGHGVPYGGFRADVIARDGAEAAPVGMFIAATSESTDSEVYGIWSTVATSTGSTGSVTNGLINAYLEARDFTGTGTSVTNLAGIEVNINTHSGPSDTLSGHIGINFARIGDGAGGVKSGTALWAVGSGAGDADWAQFAYFRQGYEDAIVLGMDNPLAGGAVGYYRIYNLGQNLQIRQNTAAGRDFSTFRTPFLVDGSTGTVFLGGAGSGGDAITMRVFPNATGVSMYGPVTVDGMAAHTTKIACYKASGVLGYATMTAGDISACN